MRLWFFAACGAAILYAVIFVAYCASRRLVKDAVSMGALVAVAVAAVAWLAAVS